MRGFEGLGRVDPAALDASHRRLDRQGIRPRLRKPLGADRAAASPGARISQAGSHLAQARPQNAEGVYRELRRPVEFQGRRRGRDIRGRGASHHAARPVGCWAPKEQKLAIEQTSGRERINIHGAIDLETGQTRMIEAETIDAISTIRLLESLELLYPLMACIHVFLDNARYHHAKLVKEWLARPSCRIKLHFLHHLLPAPEPDRAAMGRHAQEHYPQQMLRDLRRI